MATQFKLRFKDDEQHRRVVREAAARNMSMNTYLLLQADPVSDERAQLIADTSHDTYAWTTAGAEFAELDDLLAAGPHSKPSDLGFDPAAVAVREDSA